MHRMSFRLFLLAAIFLAATHIATFFMLISFEWLLPPFAFCASAILIGKTFEQVAPRWVATVFVQYFGVALLVYSIVLFVYDLKHTRSSTGVTMIDGHYFGTYQGGVERPISEFEYHSFPNLWVRVMTAWMGIMAVFGMTPEGLNGQVRSAGMFRRR